MDRIMKYLIIIASLMSIELTVTESKDDEKLSKIDDTYFLYPLLTNICEIVDRRSKIHCYCDSTQLKTATRADCWVFNGGMAEDDPIWPSFSTQPLLEDLIFNVRSDGGLTFIPAKAIVRLDYLKHLSIQYGTIDTIPSYAFTNSSTLRQIVLKSNKISELEYHAFAQMMMLSNVSLDDNNIAELKREVFFGLPNLHVLHISNNNISVVHDGSFKHLNNLIELKLNNNYISVITRETFQGLENLSRLDLRNNKLTMLGNLVFSELWSLKELTLDDNLIELISERAFGGLKQLRRLSLSGNRLTNFYEDLLVNLGSLMMLDLSNNQLETISYDAIRSLLENSKSPSTSVYLEGNPFTCDCRLSWIYALRNQTRDENLRTLSEKVSCVTDATLDRRVGKLFDLTDKGDASHIKNTLAGEIYDDYGAVEKSEDDVDGAYDERTQNDDEVNAVKAMRLADIPQDLLPCPRELMQSMEENYDHPVQNEIKVKSFSGSSIVRLNTICLTLTVWSL